MLHRLDFKKRSSFDLVLVVSSQCFLSFLFTTRLNSSGRSMRPPRGTACSLCMCSLKFPEFWKVQVHTTWNGRWSSVCPAGTFRWREKKNKQRKNPKENLLVKNSKRHNFIGSKWNHALQKVICSFKYKYNLWGRGLIHCYILNFYMAKCCFSCLLGKIHSYQTPWFYHQIKH